MTKELLRSLCAVASLLAVHALAETNDGLHGRIDQLSDQVESNVIQWRRHFHQNPELSNREFKTAERIAEHLRGLGLEVSTGVAHTGVVGVLRGGLPGLVVGLRADMDALPVTERVDVPFASKVRSVYNGQDVGVMHACGHDTHISILMGVASVLTAMKDQLPGTVKFIFQPAEEGAPNGEEGGAKLMVKEGVLKNPDVDAIFGLHIWAGLDANHISYRSGGLMASADPLRIVVHGKQTHGSTPWQGADPITAAAEIINGLQTIVSRQVDLTKAPAVVTIGAIHGGVRNNIIPETVEMIGTIRALDSEMQTQIHDKIRHVATTIADAMGTTAEVQIGEGYPVTENDPALTEWAAPILKRVAGAGNVKVIPPITGAEDFSFYQKEIPGFFFFLGGKKPAIPATEAAPHHTPDFYVDEQGLKLGVRTLANLAVDYLARNP